MPTATNAACSRYLGVARGVDRPRGSVFLCRPSTAATRGWPDPGRFALTLVLAFTLVLISAWAWGDKLVRSLLPLTQDVLTGLDDRFGVVSLDVERNAQDCGPHAGKAHHAAEALRKKW